MGRCERACRKRTRRRPRLEAQAKVVQPACGSHAMQWTMRWIQAWRRAVVPLVLTEEDPVQPNVSSFGRCQARPSDISQHVGRSTFSCRFASVGRHVHPSERHGGCDTFDASQRRNSPHRKTWQVVVDTRTSTTTCLFVPSEKTRRKPHPDRWDWSDADHVGASSDRAVPVGRRRGATWTSFAGGS